MKSTVENLEPTRVKVTVEVPYEELKKDMDAAYRDIAKQVDVPGFRRGKVPARVIDQRFGRVAVIEQVVNEVLPKFYSQVVAENDLRVMSQPDVEVTEIPNATGPLGGQLVFVAEVPVIPPFELPSVDGVELEVDPIEITDEDVEKELDELLTRFATLKTIDREAAEGDFATIDMVAMIGDEEIDSVSDVSYEIGSNSMLEGMDEALTGASAGDEIKFTTKLAGGDHKGEEAEVTINVSALKARELPEADDDFAQMVSEFDTIEELREDLKTQSGNRKRADQALQARDRLLDHILNEIDLQLPESIVEAQAKIAVPVEASEEELAEAKEKASRRLAEQVVLEELAAEVKPNITQQELFDFMMQTSQMYGIDMGEMFQNNEQIQNMVAELSRTKALALTLAKVTVKDTEGEEVDLSEFTRDPSAEESAAEEDDESASSVSSASSASSASAESAE
ncbi:MAG: trigger factor [Actinomycetaceae bacterium]|nr:trigger factor [Actinomycetaceae bacterium]